MGDVLAAYPGARRALFRKYHIGGCSSCGFAPEETLGQLCARNGNLNVDEVIAHIQASHEADRQLEITPKEVAERYHLAPGVQVQLQQVEEGIILTPLDVAPWFSPEWERALDLVLDHYREALEMLGE